MFDVHGIICGIRYCTVLASLVLVAELDGEQLLHTYMYMYNVSVSAGNDATCTRTGTSKSYDPPVIHSWY